MRNGRFNVKPPILIPGIWFLASRLSLVSITGADPAQNLTGFKGVRKKF